MNFDSRKSIAAHVLVATSFCAEPVFAHHSYAEYDSSRTVEVSGTLLDVQWSNPHIRFTLQSVPDESGNVTTWDIEGHSLSFMRRTNITADQLKPGDKIRIAGDPSRRTTNRMYATNLLRADGVELLLLPGMKPRWKDAPSQFTTSWFNSGVASRDNAGIFKVWSMKLDDPVELWRRTYPLTEKAKAQHATWDRRRDTITRGCEPKGMPTIMEQPYPIEFVQKSNVVLLRIEEYDTVRTIYLDAKQVPTVPVKSRLGVSVGRWEGSTLVVTTDRIDWPYLDPNGVPLGANAKLVERFVPTADGSSLAYALTVNSPEIFVEPLELKRNWVSRSEETVQPYRCRE